MQCKEKTSDVSSREKKMAKASVWLIALCWLVYTCSYIGKLGYNANIIQIEQLFNVSHAEAGTVGTFFFFAYGAGQIINGIFCKKYNVKYVVFGGLILSGLMNVLLGVGVSFAAIKYLWIINGAALSVLWVSLIRFLSETLDKKYMAKAVVAMGTTVAIGTFLVYGMSALFVAFNNFKLVFYVAGILLPLIAFVWLISAPSLAGKLKRGEMQEKAEESNDSQVQDPAKKPSVSRGLWMLLSIFAIYAIITNLIKDGLTTWVPIVLNELYELPGYMSILLTLLLPIGAVFGTAVAVEMNKKVKNFVSLCAIMFAASSLLVGLVIVLLAKNVVAITVLSFTLVSCLMAGVNNVITSMIPLYWREKINSGLVAGVLNGFCYVGSTISSYVLGYIADFSGWAAVFWLLLSLCIVATVIGLVQYVAEKSGSKKVK